MNGIRTIFKKELADHLSSNRFLILFALIFMVSLVTAYMAGMSISKQSQGAIAEKFIFLKLFTSSGGWFSLVQFVAFFGPLIGLILGFDTVNRERNEGTLSKLLSQPIYRDSQLYFRSHDSHRRTERKSLPDFLAPRCRPGPDRHVPRYLRRRIEFFLQSQSFYIS